MADYTITRHGQRFTVTPRTTAALVFLLLETSKEQRPSQTLAELDLTSALAFTSKAVQKGFNMNSDTLTTHQPTIPPTWARLKDHYFKNPKEQNGGLFQRHSGMLPDLETFGKLIPSTFEEVQEWRDDRFRAVYISHQDRAILTYTEGDLDLEQYPDEKTYAGAIEKCRQFYTGDKPAGEPLPPVKRLQDWEGSGLNLDQFLQIGDAVDVPMFDYFLGVLPPATCTSELLQIGEPYSHVKGRATFNTLHKENGLWIYRGHCYRGEHQEPTV